MGRFADIFWAVALAAASGTGGAVTSQNAIGKNKVGRLSGMVLRCEDVDRGET
jgi:hypothetical protein